MFSMGGERSRERTGQRNNRIPFVCQDRPGQNRKHADLVILQKDDVSEDEDRAQPPYLRSEKCNTRYSKYRRR
ncbi:hypothetical protein TNCV_677881 [Trichonephila clavipes]|nr:hypothetical protein TNCV_677881 [Trichonephila clavipes]